LIALSGKHPPPETLLAMAVRVGADVPFFLPGGAALVEGLGERLTPLPWSVPFHAVIVRPAFGLSTREGYARLGRGPGDPPPRGHVPSLRTFPEVAAVVRNDFEAAWGPSHPEIAAIKRELAAAGSAAAGLSGSGSALFGLFASEGAAREARGRMSAGDGGGKGRRVFVARSI
jgi:4-diphosphocytidyl-2-C-methyl-D-erythritol kinase